MFKINVKIKYIFLYIYINVCISLPLIGKHRKRIFVKIQKHTCTQNFIYNFMLRNIGNINIIKYSARFLLFFYYNARYMFCNSIN